MREEREEKKAAQNTKIREKKRTKSNSRWRSFRAAARNRIRYKGTEEAKEIERAWRETKHGS